MLDTPRLANRLNAAGMDRAQAETLADELNAQLREGVATKADLAALEQRVTSRLTVVLLLAIRAHFAGVWWLFAGLGDRVAAIEAFGRAAGAG